MDSEPAWVSVFPDRQWRCCYLETGEPKHRFTKQEAKRVRDRMNRQGKRMVAYRCPVCQDAWHVGHER